ncbi:MAG: phosphoribosylformylglycinamidine synthase subunit PurS [Acetobacteraceae bacterium]|nr:phosphoribosylformylglycinamidine synthase subunit PurS [Acetobacteraceae bacterium]
MVAEVWLRRGVLDPQGQAVRGALRALGYEGVRDVRVGKLVELRLCAPGRDAAEGQVRAMCSRLLANPVLEDFRVAAVEPAEDASDAGSAGSPAGPSAGGEAG